MFQLACPKCKTLVTYDENNPYRPFCSERCKLVDFGAWATEEYTITAKASNLKQNQAD